MKTKHLFALAIPMALVAEPVLAHAEVNQPQEIIMRPRTTPGGQITVFGDLGILLIPDLDTSIGLGFGGSYGVDDHLEVGVGYDLGFAPSFEAKGTLAVEAAYGLIEGNLGVAADVSTGYDLLAEGMAPLGLGARVQFRLNDQLAIVSPGHQLEIALSGDPKPIALGLPVGVAYQASPSIYAFVNTSIGNISISNSATTFIFADNLPLQVGAFFSPSNTMDVGAAVTWLDLENSADTIGFTLAARLHL